MCASAGARLSEHAHDIDDQCQWHCRRSWGTHACTCLLICPCARAFEVARWGHLLLWYKKVISLAALAHSVGRCVLQAQQSVWYLALQSAGLACTWRQRSCACDSYTCCGALGRTSCNQDATQAKRHMHERQTRARCGAGHSCERHATRACRGPALPCVRT